MTDTQLMNALEQFLQIDPKMKLERNGRDVQIIFGSYGRTAYGWSLRDAVAEGLSVVSDLVARKLLQERLV